MSSTIQLVTLENIFCSLKVAEKKVKDKKKNASVQQLTIYI